MDRPVEPSNTVVSGFRARAGAAVENFSRHPVTGAATTLSIILAGVLGSIYAAEIKTFRIFWLARQLGGPVLFFVLAAVAAGLFFLERTAARNAARRARTELLQATDKLIRETDELKHLVRTVPPSDFLVLFERIYTRLAHLTNVTVAADSDPAQLDTLDASIRVVLAGVGALARKFDLRTPGASHAVYGINIMVFRPVADGDEAWNHVAARCSHIEPGMQKNGETLLGVLHLEPTLSTTTTTSSRETDAEADGALRDGLVLPVPAEKYRNAATGKSKVLPGAPAALLAGVPKLYPTTDEFFADLEKRCGFSDDVRIESKNYFAGARENIKSFLCIPLIRYGGAVPAASENAKHERYEGVLNIHGNHERLLGQDDLAEQFAILALPFVSMLIRLLGKRRTMELEKAAARVSLEPATAGT